MSPFKLECIITALDTNKDKDRLHMTDSDQTVSRLIGENKNSPEPEPLVVISIMSLNDTPPSMG